MTRNRGERCVARAAHAALALVAITAAAVTATTLRGDDTRPTPRSHIQPVGEIAAPATASAAPSGTAFGLQVARVPDLLRQHLDLGYGIGLVVTDVAAASAAHGRGFLPNDVLVSIDDQSLIVPEQLAVLLEGAGPAAPRSCTLIRHGTRMTIPLDGPTATEPAAASPAPDATPQANMEVEVKTKPPTQAKRPPLKPAASTLALLPDRKKARSLAIASGVKPAAGVVRRKGDDGVLQEDFDYSIEVSRKDETRLVARDARGRRVFDDAIETPEQRSRIPLAIRDRVEQLERLLDRQLQATTRQQPVAEIGSLDITPIQVK